MPITSNEGGVLYELDTVSANENGVLYELTTVVGNESGVLYTIHEPIPSKLLWVNGSGGTLVSSSNNGFNLVAKSASSSTYSSMAFSDQAAVTSTAVRLKAGTTIYITGSCSTSGTSGKNIRFLVYDSDKKYLGGIFYSANSYTITTTGIYYFAVSAHGVTGSQSGVNYYIGTGTFAISIY